MSMKSLRGALAAVILAGSMGLLNVPSAHAIDLAQAGCIWDAEAAYNQRNAQNATIKDPTSRAIEDAASYAQYHSRLGWCRMRGSEVGSFPYRSRF
jgi:hypothetical protein